MGGLVIETIRPGVQFTPDAAAAFRRAEARVQAEFGRNIGVNSTYRSWDQQMSMYNAWNAYVNGTGPYPGHSKAIHPMYSRHTGGTALDSSDWGNARIRQILADNGFIRNQLHVPNEEHHFEYIRSQDKNYGKEDDLTPEESKMLKAIHNRVTKGLTGDRIAHAIWTYQSGVNKRKFGDMLRTLWDDWRVGRTGNWHHGTATAAFYSEIGAQKAYRLSHGGSEAIDVEELAEAVSANLNQVDAEKLAEAIVKKTGEKLSGK